MFIKAVLANPNVLLNSNIRAKNKAHKFGTIFECIKQLPVLDQNISFGNFQDLRPFIKFERMHFVRSFEYIHCFTSSTLSDKSLCAVIVGRKLQVYNYVSSKLLFELNVPNASAYIKSRNV